MRSFFTAEIAEMTDKELDELTRKTIGATINVHRALGPGLLESAYESCLLFELNELGLNVEQQKPLPVRYRSVQLDCGYRLDLVVESEVIVEIKSVEQLAPSIRHSCCRTLSCPAAKSGS